MINELYENRFFRKQDNDTKKNLCKSVKKIQQEQEQ